MENKKTITEQEFLALIKNAKIEEGNMDGGDHQVEEQEQDEDGEIDYTYTEHVWGWTWNTLDLSEIGEISYQNAYSHVAGKPSTAEYDSSSNYCGYNFDNFCAVVVDEDGDEIDFDELEKHLRLETNIEDISIDAEDEILDMTATEIDGDAKMETIIVKRDKDLDIKFTGELITGVESSFENAQSNYSGNPGYCTELNLYKTSGGKFVCEKIEYTRYQGQHTRYFGEICEDEGQVIDYFGTGWLAKDLYNRAGIEAVELVA